MYEDTTKSMNLLFLLVLLMIYTNAPLEVELDSLHPSECCNCNAKTNKAFQEVKIVTSVFLEGAYLLDEGVMSNKLNVLGYLPGQRPKTVLGHYTASGQPYKKKPWGYSGKEGVMKKNEPYQYPLDMVDWILISLRENKEASSTVLKASGLLYRDGTIDIVSDSGYCCLDVSKSYYIVIEHRNHLPVMTDYPVSIINGQLFYDFRHTGSYEMGQKELTKGIFAMYAGNADQEENKQSIISINQSDIESWKRYNGLNSSYFLVDLDLSGDVSIKDEELIYRNIGIVSKVPF